jgi:hypothetical protein
VNLWGKAAGVVTDVHPRACVGLAGVGRVTKHFTFHTERLQLIKKVEAFGETEFVADDHLMRG